MASDHPLPADIEILRTVLDTALDAVVVMAGDGAVAAWNEVAEHTFGWKASEAIGRPMAELIVPVQHREAHEHGLRRYLETREERVLNRRIEISALHKDGREFPVELSITTGPSRSELVFIGFLRDISQRKEAEARLRRQARETQLLFDVTRMAAETDSFEDALRSCLEAICNLAGWPVGHALVMNKVGHSELISTSVWYEEVPGMASALKEATAELRFTPGVGLPGMILDAAEPVWVSNADQEHNFPRKHLGFEAAFGFPIMSEGRIIAALEFFSESATQPDADLLLIARTLGEQVGRVLERKRTEEHQRLLVNELNHRVKNTLAVVQAIASQTFKDASLRPETRQAFESRLAALAAAHDLLTTENWETASLRQVIEKAGLGCGADAGRLDIGGPDLRVPPRTAVSIVMAVHELCTNAVKYGALSNESGTVAVTWDVTEVDGAAALRLSWVEQGGPPVSSPGRKGFGTRMIERSLAADLGGTVTLEFPPEGVRCTVEAPLPTHDEADARPA